MAVSPFSIPHEDRLELYTSRGFRTLRAYLEENVESTFCHLHRSNSKAHPTWLLHRAILHALVAPVVEIYRQASALAESALAAGSASYNIPAEGREAQARLDFIRLHSRRCDPDLTFHGLARDAFVWMHCFVDAEPKWCESVGCPACITQHTFSDEAIVRLLLAALALSEAYSKSFLPTETTLSTAPSTPTVHVTANEEDQVIPIPVVDVDSEGDTTDTSSVADSLDGGASSLGRVSTASSLATSIAGSATPSLCASPHIYPSDSSLVVASQLHLGTTSTCCPRQGASGRREISDVVSEAERPTLPDMLFFRPVLLNAIMDDPLWGPQEVAGFVERGSSLALGLQALIAACEQLQASLTEQAGDVDEGIFMASEDDNESLETMMPTPEADEDDLETSAVEEGWGVARSVAWVDEKDLLDLGRSRRAATPFMDPVFEQHSNNTTMPSAGDDVITLARLAGSWRQRQIWALEALHETISDARERRRFVGLLAESGADRSGVRKRRNSWA